MKFVRIDKFSSLNYLFIYHCDCCLTQILNVCSYFTRHVESLAIFFLDRFAFFKFVVFVTNVSMIVQVECCNVIKTHLLRVTFCTVNKISPISTLDIRYFQKIMLFRDCLSLY